MDNKKFYSLIFIALTVIILSFCVTAKAQHNQFEGKFIFHPNQETIVSKGTDGFGGGLELTTNLGEYIKLLQRFDIEKTRNGDSFNNFNQRDITFQSTVRLYPVEKYFSLKPFVQGGLRARFNKFKSTAIIPLPGGDPGNINTDNKFVFTSPFVGAGVNYKNYYILEYNYFLPDFTSEIVDIQQPSPFFRERGHSLRAKGYIPIGHHFSFNPEYEIFRRETEFAPSKYDHKIGFGLAYRFGNEATVDLNAKPKSSSNWKQAARVESLSVP